MFNLDFYLNFLIRFFLCFCRMVASYSWWFLLCTVAKWSWCQHFLPHLSLDNSDMVLSCVELFGLGHWTRRWATIWKSSCQMVDRFNELGLSLMLSTGVAWSYNCHTRLDDWSWSTRYLFSISIFIKRFLWRWEPCSKISHLSFKYIRRNAT